MNESDKEIIKNLNVKYSARELSDFLNIHLSTFYRFLNAFEKGDDTKKGIVYIEKLKKVIILKI